MVSGLLAIVAILDLIAWLLHKGPIWVAAIPASTAILSFIGSKLDGQTQFEAKAAKMRERIVKSKEHR